MPIISVLRRWKQEDQEFEGILGYISSVSQLGLPETLVKKRRKKQRRRKRKRMSRRKKGGEGGEKRRKKGREGRQFFDPLQTPLDRGRFPHLSALPCDSLT